MAAATSCSGGSTVFRVGDVDLDREEERAEGGLAEKVNWLSAIVGMVLIGMLIVRDTP